MNPQGEQTEWELLNHGTGREHLDDPASVPIGPAPDSATFSVSLAPAAGSTSERESRGRQRRSMVRPYTRTGGRTKSSLELEALVSTSEHGRRVYETGSSEYRRICELCLETRSVAEVAAILGFPLGVGKVLVEDLAEAGLVFVHKPGLVAADRSSLEFLERVLNGLRSL